MRLLFATMLGIGAACFIMDSAAAEAPAEHGKCVALTFDDGPSPRTTPRLLDVLKVHGVTATFFVVGKNVAAWRDIVKRTHAEGHEIGNHSWSHPWLSKMSTEAAKREIDRTDDELKQVTGEKPKIIRAPFGAMPADLKEVGDGRPFIGWGPDPRDSFHRSTAAIIRIAVAQSVNGSIPILHDTNSWSIAAVPAIILGLKKRGFRFVTVSQFLKGECGFVPKPRLVYEASYVPAQMNKYLAKTHSKIRKTKRPAPRASSFGQKGSVYT